MGNSLQNEPYWSKIHWELAKLRQNMPVQSQYAFMISILLSRIGARTGNIKTKLLIRHHMRDEGMATYSFRFLTSYSNIRILLRSKKYSNFEFYSYSLGALFTVWPFLVSQDIMNAKKSIYYTCEAYDAWVACIVRGTPLRFCGSLMEHAPRWPPAARQTLGSTTWNSMRWRRATVYANVFTFWGGESACG